MRSAAEEIHPFELDPVFRKRVQQQQALRKKLTEMSSENLERTYNEYEEDYLSSGLWGRIIYCIKNGRPDHKFYQLALEVLQERQQRAPAIFP